MDLKVLISRPVTSEACDGTGTGWQPMEDRKTNMASDVRLRRVYDGSSPTAGKRVLVDRVWPRGLKKESLALDLWLRDLGPSDETGTVQFGPMAIMIAIALVGGMLALAAFSRRDAIA